MGFDTRVFSKGAEAKLYSSSFCGFPALIKVRNPKKYRPSSLDEKIRRSRTKVEARLLSHAKDAGVLCPLVYSADEFSITMEKLSGKIFSGKKISPAHAKKFAQMLASLHSLHIIHGDFTPANLMDTKKGIAVIDFGLGFTSHDNEHKAVDLLTMKNSLGKNGAYFVQSYASAGGSSSVLSLMKKVESRARYQDRNI